NMGVHAGEMVKKSIEAFISNDRRLADQVCALDEEIDVMHRTVFKRVTLLMKSPDSPVDELMAVLSISRYIERMADHATMIAREVIYLVTGEIVRHKGDFYQNLIDSLNE
ncbi:MAG: phosphate transport system regulatory protein PhoU, partial [Chlorobiaceae bacterium]|nr:phosphate transport system regulatory protein PhoU [Chlorobiaceae bacterium]